MKHEKNYFLEIIRGVAALLVLTTHLIILHPVLNKMGLNVIANWGTESVMIFFILSGLVIGLSQSVKPKTITVFLINRFLRLFPQFIIGILLGLLAYVLLGIAIPKLDVVVGNFFMLSTLQGFLVATFQTNSPIWSLTFEAFFYILFAFSIGIKQDLFIKIWFFIALLCIPLYFQSFSSTLLQHLIAMLSFSSIWLLGYFIFKYRTKFNVSIYMALFSVTLLPLISRLDLSNNLYDPFKFLIFAIVSIPFFKFCIQEKNEGLNIKFITLIPIYIFLLLLLFYFSEARVISKILYSVLPVIAIIVYKIALYFNLTFKIKKNLNAFGALTGKYSFSVYIIHFPILFVLASFIINPFLFIIISLIIVFGFAYLLENFFQKKLLLIYYKWQAK